MGGSSLAIIIGKIQQSEQITVQATRGSGLHGKGKSHGSQLQINSRQNLDKFQATYTVSIKQRGFSRPTEA